MHSREVHAAEFQKLAVMAEAAQITGFSQNGQRIDRPDSRYRAQQLIIWMVGEQLCRTGLEVVSRKW
ncbi:MAG: hypothetical protein RLZZ444_3732 [Pseudomonadota bacterium]